MEKAITSVFLESQKSIASHPKLIKKLLNIYLKSEFESFCRFFIHLLQVNLIHGEKFPIIERTLTFIATFCTSVKSVEKEKDQPTNESEDEDCDIDPFLVRVFEFLLENHEANSKAVRYRVCQLINKILNSMGVQASIDDDLYSTIYDTMLQRLMDKIPAVRVQAILALSRLQDPQNKDCPVIKAYLFHLSMDPNPEVRKAVLNNMAITIQTLPDIIERIKDVRDTVRRQAYLLLAQKVHIRSFTIAQRILLISEGLKDRSQIVRQAVKKSLLQAWLRLVDGNILNLLKSLDVEASTESAELALNSLFEDVSYPILLENLDILDERKLVPVTTLTAESALLWKCTAKHFRSEKADEYLDEMLPDLSVFCDYLREFVLQEGPPDEDPQDTAVKMMEKDFICQQLIALSTVFDLADEVGRKSLRSLGRELFLTPSTGEACIKCLSEVFAQLYSPEERVNKLAEIISEIQEPPEPPVCLSSQTNFLSPTAKESTFSEEDERKRKIKIAQISVKINQVREELEECVRSLNLDKAIELKEELKTLEGEKSEVLKEGPIITPKSTPVIPSSQNKMPEEEELKLLDDPDTLSRCLLILCEFLTHSDIKVFGSILRSLHDNLVIPCLKSEDCRVRRYAVRGLGLICLISEELARQHLLLFIQISRMDVEEIQLEALQSLFDFWLLYGVEEFNSAADAVNKLPAFLDSPIGNSLNEGDSKEQSSAAGNVISLISKMLETECIEARTFIVEGLCKLLLASRITSPKLMTRLIILWYNPTTEEDHLLRHMLGVFFPLYASYGGTNQQTLSEALIPTLHEIFDAPTRSPLYNVDVEDVISFMISITSPSIVSNKTTEMVNAHDSLVFGICEDLSSFPDRNYSRFLAKGLCQLVLSPNKFDSHKEILTLTQKLIKKVSERSVLNYITKFSHSIENFLEMAPKTETEEVCLENEIQEDGERVLPTDANVTSVKRKRILYSTHSDMELISDLDSETEKSTSSIILSSEDRNEHTRRTLESESEEEENTLKKFPEDTEIDANKEKIAIEEIELTTEEREDLSDTLNVTSCESPEKCKAHDESGDIFKSVSTESEYETPGESRTSDSSFSKSPPRKSPRYEKVSKKETLRGVKKRDSPKIESDPELSTPSSQMHRSTRASSSKSSGRSRSKSEMFVGQERSAKKLEGEIKNKKKVKSVKRRSLRVQLERLTLPLRTRQSVSCETPKPKKKRSSVPKSRSNSPYKKNYSTPSSSSSNGSTLTNASEKSSERMSSLRARKRRSKSANVTPIKLVKLDSREKPSKSAREAIGKKERGYMSDDSFSSRSSSTTRCDSSSSRLSRVSLRSSSINKRVSSLGEAERLNEKRNSSSEVGPRKTQSGRHRK